MTNEHYDRPSSTFPVRCGCGCGTEVLATTGGFGATTCELDACPRQRAVGIVSTTVRKTAAYAAAVPTTTVWGHRDGLVEFR